MDNMAHQKMGIEGRPKLVAFCVRLFKGAIAGACTVSWNLSEALAPESHSFKGQLVQSVHDFVVWLLVKLIQAGFDGVDVILSMGNSTSVVFQQ